MDYEKIKKAIILTQQRKFSEAEDLYKILLKESPNNEIILSAFGLFYVSIKKFDKACEILKQACEIKETLGTLSALGFAEFERNDFEKSALYLEKSLEYGENPEIAKLIGIAHDIAKEMTDEEYLKYVEDNNIKIDEVEKINTKLLHGKVGADICKKKYNFNEQMQNAIKYHTTGNINMDNMAKIIYIADKIEDTREYDGVEEAREKARALFNDLRRLNTPIR